MVDFLWGFGRYNYPAVELAEYPPPRSAKHEKLETVSDGIPLVMVSQLHILLRLQTDNSQWLGSGEKGASAHVGMTSTLKPSEQYGEHANVLGVTEVGLPRSFCTTRCNIANPSKTVHWR